MEDTERFDQKIFSDGDMYKGNFKGVLSHGKGKYTWLDGTYYEGDWEEGKMHGKGQLVWPSGARYGKGTFYPAGSKNSPPKKWSNLGEEDSRKNLLLHSPSLTSVESRALRSNVRCSLSEKVLTGGLLRNSGRISHRSVSLDENWSALDPDKELASDKESCMVSDVPCEDQHGIVNDSTKFYEREYMQGVLIKEKVRKNAKPLAKSKEKNKFTGKEAEPRSCVDIPIIHGSYYLMLNLQLGIRYTVGKITPVPMREVRSSDFGERARIRMYFPRKGSQFTPPHYSIDFYWKDYCPMVFRNLREMFKLDAAEYMMSICGNDGLREISSPGKSGSIFYLSHDDRFIIKTLKKSELKAFLNMLLNYYHHVGEYENTLITKFFGVHRIKLKGGRKVRFVIMGNMFCTELRIHRRYDLKGSTIGRCTSKEKISQDTTLKDLDLSYEFHMDKRLQESLFNQLSLDCSFLESQGIIDYSLLLGVHFRAPEHLQALLDTANVIPDHEISSVDGVNSPTELAISPKGLRLVTHEPSSVNKAPGAHIRGRTLRAYSVGDKEVDLLLPGTARLRVQLGVNMPAQANHKLLQDEDDSAEAELFEVYDVVLYMGIIDILQEYNLKKKAEHACKSLQFNPLQISVVEPKLYAKRFINFLEKVFPANHKLNPR